MAKVIATCPSCSLFDDGCFAGATLPLGYEVLTAGMPRADTLLNPPHPNTGLQADWEWANLKWSAYTHGLPIADDPHEQTSEVCPICGRNKDPGKRCRWCGN